MLERKHLLVQLVQPQDYYGIASGAIKIEFQYTNGLAGIYRANENLQISDGVGAEQPSIILPLFNVVPLH